MGIVIVKIKLMPSSVEADLEKIKKEAQTLVEQSGGENCKFEVEPIAFGLKAIIMFFSWPEEKELESLEESIKEIEDINSVQIIDMRRAIG